MVNRRGVIAAVLGFVYPGLGHVYLRKWLRALSWFVLALATAALVVPDSAYQAFEADGFDGLMAASESFGTNVTLSLLAIRLLNVADAYVVAVREAREQVAEAIPTPGEAVRDAAGGDESGDAQPASCPACGKELDPDLDFCPWCTTELDGDGDADAT
ncbi:zinc ribbon domain-containing protein [Halobacterium yunchengense]|uniref:zinc ribbon domain-containing protein n=1 Tax=Halobacterium yunchengense TaxID=3108497 RepID=UPI00300901DD